MTQNEVSIIKNAVLDATEAYVDARLSVLDFVKTQIGVVQSYVQRNKKFYHTVKCNATSGTTGITYNNVLSVGNTPFPVGSVVFMIVPNAQYTNQFILGKLDDTPCHITAGSISLGDVIYLTSTPEWEISEQDYSYGNIANFKIFRDRLRVGDAVLSPKLIGCGSAGRGLVNIVAGNEVTEDNYISLSDDGNTTQTKDGIRIHGYFNGSRGVVQFYDGNYTVTSTKYLSNIPDKTIYEDPNTGYLRWS